MTTEDGTVARVIPRHNFYGRKYGKTLRVGQRAHLGETLAGIAVPGVVSAKDLAGGAGAPPPVDLAALFGRACPVWLEVGFGGGEHMLAQAAANPGVGIIGCEVFVNGVAQFLSHMARAGVENVRVHAGDARDLLAVLPEASLARAFLLYPDPWPKQRHHRRRFVNPDGLDPLARALAPGAEVRVATDIPDYVRHTRAEMARRDDFQDVTLDDHVAWPDWHRTRYEAKALREGRVPQYLTYRRV